jgi:hypothetical protein
MCQKAIVCHTRHVSNNFFLQKNDCLHLTKPSPTNVGVGDLVKTAMDDLLLQYHNLVNDGEETGFLDDEEDTRMLAATLIAGIELARLDRVKTRNPKRLYLCHAHLLPDPHQNTPWQVLYASHSDRAFITTMGIDVLTFEFILTSGFASLWYHKSITHPDTNSQGIPCLNHHSLDAGGALGLVLHYLNSTMHETSLQQIFALIPATVSHYLSSGLPIL